MYTFLGDFSNVYEFQSITVLLVDFVPLTLSFLIKPTQQIHSRKYLAGVAYLKLLLSQHILRPTPLHVARDPLIPGVYNFLIHTSTTSLQSHVQHSISFEA